MVVYWWAVLIAHALAISFINFFAEGCNAPEVSIIKGKKFLLLSFASSEYLVFFKWWCDGNNTKLTDEQKM